MDFILAAFREKGDGTDYARLHDVFGEVWVVDKETPEKCPNTYPKQIREWQSRSMTALLAELARQKRPIFFRSSTRNLRRFGEQFPTFRLFLWSTTSHSLCTSKSHGRARPEQPGGLPRVAEIRAGMAARL